jgi:hypothetical protein
MKPTSFPAWICLLALVLAHAAPALASSPPAGNPGAVALQRAWWLAYAQGDAKALAAHTAPEASAAFSSGKQMSRHELLVEAASHPASPDFRMDWSEETVRSPRPGLAIVTGLSTEGTGASSQQFRIVTAIDKVGRPDWHVVHAQSTRVSRFAEPVAPSIAGPIADYAGDYLTPKGKLLRMELRDARLWMVEPSGKGFELTPIGPGLFEPVGRSPLNGVLRLFFARDAMGRVASFSRLVEGRVDTFPRVGLAPSPVAMPEPSPEAVVQAQLDAYNRRDLEGFLSTYADDAVLVKHPDQVTQAGKAQMRERYAKRFANPNIRAEILQRMTFGRFVIDRERVTAPPAKGELEAVAIYEVRDGKIVRVTFLEH